MFFEYEYFFFDLFIYWVFYEFFLYIFIVFVKGSVLNVCVDLKVKKKILFYFMGILGSLVVNIVMFLMMC